MTGVCCCVRFLDTDGNGRHVAHSCCPTHGRPADPTTTSPAKAHP